MAEDLTEIVFMASDYGYEEIVHQEENKMVSLSKNGIRVNVYYTKMTVGISGKINKIPYQKFIKNVSKRLLQDIFSRSEEFLKTGKAQKTSIW